MIFKFKEKPIVLDCFTRDRICYEVFKPDHARKFIPEWWKKLPNSVDIKDDEGRTRIIPGRTMKTCHGFMQNYQHGIIIPLWTDIVVALGEKGSRDFSFDSPLEEPQVGVHMDYERGSYLSPDEYQHLKFLSPWIFKCNDEVKWIMQSPTWNFPRPEEMIIPPGILDYKYQGSTHINLFVRYIDQPRMIDFTAGMPMAHIIPLSERKLKINHHLVSEDEYNKLTFKTNTLSHKSYDRLLRMIRNQKAEAEAESKCPFSKMFR